MKYKTDSGGFAASCDDLKIFFNSSTWATRLSQLSKSAEKLIVMTNGFGVRSSRYFTESIEDENSYIRSILNKRPNNIFILCNSSNIADAKVIKKLYRKLESNTIKILMPISHCLGHGLLCFQVKVLVTVRMTIMG